MIALYVLVEFLCGALMFSYWLGLAVKKDLFQEGDGNPGAYNLWHAAGCRMGLLGVALDFLKGYFPLTLLVRSGLVDGWAIVPAAIAPVLGHAFSPFLRGRGGKAIAVTFGVWSAVTAFEASLVYAVLLALYSASAKLLSRGKPIPSDIDGFAAVMGIALMGVYLVVRAFPPPILLLWLLNALLLAFTNRMKIRGFFKLVLFKNHE
jgi:acyl-phosphate glycerol 3-phosphate acyltransferase